MNFGENALVTRVKVFAIKFDKRERQHVPARNFHSLTCRFSGRISVETDALSLLSTPGTVTYIPAGQAYDTEVQEEGKMIAVHFTMEEALALPPAVINADEELAGRFTDLLECYRIRRDRAPACMAAFYGILANLSRVESSVSKEKNVIAAARDYIERHFHQSDLSISHLAARLDISDSYLRREFHVSYGIGPLAYLKKIRIEHAKTLLNTGYYAVSNVAELCGFSSHSYFSAEFRRLTGVSPSEYKK